MAPHTITWSFRTARGLLVPRHGWDDFVLDFADFAAKNQGVPFFNQSRNAAPEVVNQRFGTRLAFFNKVRRELDPHDRLVNQFFQSYLPPSPLP